MKIFSFFRRRSNDEANEPAPEPQVNPAGFPPPAERQVKTVNQPFSTSANFGRTAPEPQRFGGPVPPPRFGSQAAAPNFGSQAVPPRGFINTRTLLEELKQKDPGILAAFITSNEGRLTERTQMTFAGEGRIGASSAISLAVARKEMVELQLGEAKEVFIKSDRGFILLLSLGNKGVLTIVGNQRADAELILQEAHKALPRLAPGW